ncbi:MAG: tetratricopeptide repeat protein [Syntrophales bacterium]
MTLIVYGPMVEHGFISFDDDDYLTANPVVRQGLTWDGVVWAFSAPRVYNWHPLTWLSHMLDVQLFGLNAGAHHLVGLLLHIANSLLLFGVLRAMTGAPWRSGLVAALFALHPLHVESVAWAAERKDLLSTLFWLVTLGLYHRYAQEPGIRRFWPVCLCYAVSLMAKQMTVTLPFLLLLLDYWPLRRMAPLPAGRAAGGPDRKVLPAAGDGAAAYPFQRSLLGPLVAEKLPLLLLAAGASLLIYLIQAQTGIVKSSGDFPFSARLANALVAYVAYLFKTLWPLHLAVFYPHPGTALSLGTAAAAAGLLALVTVAVIRSGKPYLIVGWFWYLGTLVPVIGLVQVGVQGMADRYTYVPLIGIFIMAVWGGADLAARRRVPAAAQASFAAALLAALTVLTWFQVGTWRDDITLYSHAVRVTAGNDWAEYNLGRSLMASGRDDEALVRFQEAARLQPRYADAFLNIGVIRARQDRLDEAAANFGRALALEPANREALLNLSLALTRQGKITAAAARLERLRGLNPGDPEAWFLTGVVRVRQEDPSGAEAAYREAIRLRPDYPEAHNNLGILLARQGRLATAIDHFREALRLRPDDREAKRNLETALGAR